MRGSRIQPKEKRIRSKGGGLLIPEYRTQQRIRNAINKAFNAFRI